MEPELAREIESLKSRMDAIYASVEKTRKYFMWTLIVTLVLFVAPLIMLLFAVPAFLGTYTETLSGVSGLEGY